MGSKVMHFCVTKKVIDKLEIKRKNKLKMD